MNRNTNNGTIIILRQKHEQINIFFFESKYNFFYLLLHYFLIRWFLYNLRPIKTSEFPFSNFEFDIDFKVFSNKKPNHHPGPKSYTGSNFVYSCLICRAYIYTTILHRCKLKWRVNMYVQVPPKVACPHYPCTLTVTCELATVGKSRGGFMQTYLVVGVLNRTKRYFRGSCQYWCQLEGLMCVLAI